MNRLVVISNRMPPEPGHVAAGGLAVALHAALRQRGGLWLGWSGGVAGVAGRRLHAQADWAPLRYVSRCFSHDVLMGLLNAAHVGLVTPLRDGMNLVAKELIAALRQNDLRAWHTRFLERLQTSRA